jgi:hypothetical protein
VEPVTNNDRFRHPKRPLLLSPSAFISVRVIITRVSLSNPLPHLRPIRYELVGNSVTKYAAISVSSVVPPFPRSVEIK